MSDLTLFHFENQAVRVVYDGNGEPWFVAVDVCAALDVKNGRQAVARLDEDERRMFNIRRQGDTFIINESGLYSLVLGSRKPEAKKFKKWVTSVLLPSIRKRGYLGAEVLEPRIEQLPKVLSVRDQLKMKDVFALQAQGQRLMRLLRAETSPSERFNLHCQLRMVNDALGIQTLALASIEQDMALVSVNMASLESSLRQNED